MDEDSKSAKHILTRRTLHAILAQIDSSSSSDLAASNTGTGTETLDPDVENFLLDLSDEFLYNVVQAGCRLAKHRAGSSAAATGAGTSGASGATGGDTLTVRDLALHLETMYNIRIPGFGLDEVRQARKPTVPTGHQQRLNQVRKAMQSDANERKDRL